jgi:hypothetical protein
MAKSSSIPLRAKAASSVSRSGRKMNLTGELDDVQWERSELALFIRDGDAIEQLFMDVEGVRP